MFGPSATPAESQVTGNLVAAADTHCEDQDHGLDSQTKPARRAALLDSVRRRLTLCFTGEVVAGLSTQNVLSGWNRASNEGV